VVLYVKVELLVIIWITIFRIVCVTIFQVIYVTKFGIHCILYYETLIFLFCTKFIILTKKITFYIILNESELKVWNRILWNVCDMEFGGYSCQCYSPYVGAVMWMIMWIFNISWMGNSLKIIMLSVFLF